MKRLTVLLVLLMLLLCVTAPAQAGNDVNGVKYRVNITMPAGHDHIYLYDQPSSSNGKNLGRINNGEYVIGISSVERKGYTWIYCDYNGIEGYIRKNNLVKVSNGSVSSSKSSGSSSSSSNGSGNVTFSGSVNVRTGPGLDYGKMGAVNRSDTLTYAGDTSYDNRGVAWYSVYYNGSKGWVSSKYASVKGGTPGESSSSGKSSSDSNAKLVELSGYYGKNIANAANALGGGFSIEYWDGEDAIDVTYEKYGLWMAANGTTIKEIRISGHSKYALLGITVGMSKSDAEKTLKKYTVMGNYGNSAEYVIKGTKSNWDILLDIDYSNGRVTSVDYGIWS